MRRAALALAFLSCVPAANWMIGHVGACVPGGPCLIPVAPGLSAPSGVLLVGLALALRDALHELEGRAWVLALVAAGAALSLAVAPPALAVASAAAFLLGELADFAVYDRLRRRSPAWAVMASGLLGAAADSLVFSWLAFGTAGWAPGLLLGKVYASAGFALWRAAGRRRPTRRSARDKSHYRGS